FSRGMNGAELRGEADRAWPVGGQVHHQRLVRIACETLALEMDAALRVTRERNSVGDIEAAAVFRYRPVGELQIQIAQRPLALLLPAEPVLRGVIGYLREFAGAELAHHLIEIFCDSELSEIASAGLAGVERVVIECDALFFDAAEN